MQESFHAACHHQRRGRIGDYDIARGAMLSIQDRLGDFVIPLFAPALQLFSRRNWNGEIAWLQRPPFHDGRPGFRRPGSARWW